MVCKVPFFEKCSSAVVQMVVHRLVPEVYLEGDFVLRAGDPGHALAGLDQRIGWVQTSVESVGAKLGSMEAEVSKMAVAHEGLERRVVGALEQILHRVNEMERKMPRGRAGM